MGLKGATLRVPITSYPQMSGLASVESKPDGQPGIAIGVDMDPVLSFDMGADTQPSAQSASSPSTSIGHL